MLGYIVGWIIFRYVSLSFTEIHGPDSNVVKKEIYRFGSESDQCYQYQIDPVVCPLRSQKMRLN